MRAAVMKIIEGHHDQDMFEKKWRIREDGRMVTTCICSSQEAFRIQGPSTTQVPRHRPGNEALPVVGIVALPDW